MAAQMALHRATAIGRAPRSPALLAGFLGRFATWQTRQRARRLDAHLCRDLRHDSTLVGPARAATRPGWDGGPMPGHCDERLALATPQSRAHARHH